MFGQIVVIVDLFIYLTRHLSSHFSFMLHFCITYSCVKFYFNRLSLIICVNLNFYYYITLFNHLYNFKILLKIMC